MFVACGFKWLSPAIKSTGIIEAGVAQCCVLPKNHLGPHRSDGKVIAPNLRNA